MKKSALMKLSLVSLLSVTGLAACGTSSSATNSKTQSLNWMQSANLITLDPSKSVDVNSANTLNNVDEALLSNPTGNQVKPGVAKSYSVSKDGKIYTFHLRNSKWSNGDPVTANDFVYSLQRTVNPKTASQDAYLYDHLVNYTQVQKGKLAPTKLGASAPNKTTLVVHLSKPQVYFKYLAAGLYPQNQKVAEKYGKKYGTNSSAQVYNGAFKATKWTGANDNYTLVKNDQYWAAKNVKLKKVNINVVKDNQTGLNDYQTGKLDELTLSTKQQVNHFKNSSEYHAYPSTYSNFIEMNEKKVPAFKNLKIRRALSMAVNREQFVKDVMGNGSKPTKGFVGSGLASYKGQDFADAGYVKSAVGYNKTQALKLWKQGLKEVGLKKMNLTLTYDDTDVAKSTTEFLQNAFQQLPGLKVTNVNLPRQQRIARLFAENFDLCVTGWQPSFSDPMAVMNIKTSGSSINFSQWKNAEYDKLVSKAENEDANNPTKRWDDLVKAEKVFGTDQGAIPFYQNANPTVIKKNVKGVQYNNVSGSWDFSKAYVK